MPSLPLTYLQNFFLAFWVKKDDQDLHEVQISQFKCKILNSIKNIYQVFCYIFYIKIKVPDGCFGHNLHEINFKYLRVLIFYIATYTTNLKWTWVKSSYPCLKTKLLVFYLPILPSQQKAIPALQLFKGKILESIWDPLFSHSS